MSDGSEPINPHVFKKLVYLEGSTDFKDSYYVDVLYSGLTKREYFAGLAMQGMLANEQWMQAIIKLEKQKGGLVSEGVAKSSVEFADALLKELSSNKESGE